MPDTVRVLAKHCVRKRFRQHTVDIGSESSRVGFERPVLGNLSLNVRNACYVLDMNWVLYSLARRIFKKTVDVLSLDSQCELDNPTGLVSVHICRPHV